MIRLLIYGVLESSCKPLKSEDHLFLTDLSSYKMLVGSLPIFLDGVCQWPCLLDHFVSKNARRLVGELLVKASDRLGPDRIVEHPFIAEGTYLEDMSSTLLSIAPMSPTHGSVRDASLLHHYCRLAGVGRDEQGDSWPCVETEESQNGISVRREGIWSLGIKWSV